MYTLFGLNPLKGFPSNACLIGVAPYFLSWSREEVNIGHWCIISGGKIRYPLRRIFQEDYSLNNGEGAQTPTNVSVEMVSTRSSQPRHCRCVRVPPPYFREKKSLGNSSREMCYLKCSSAEHTVFTYGICQRSKTLKKLFVLEILSQRTST